MLWDIVKKGFVDLIFNSITDIGLLKDGVELSGSNYRRIPITPSFHLELYEDEDAFYITNKQPISFPRALSDWGEFNQIGIFSGTTLWFTIKVDLTSVKKGDQVYFDNACFWVVILKKEPFSFIVASAEERRALAYKNEGLVVYDTDCKCFAIWNGEKWDFLTGMSTYGSRVERVTFTPSLLELPVGFIINGNGYIGAGGLYSQYFQVWTIYKEFYKFNFVEKVWTQIADFGGGERAGLVGFSLQGYGYAGTGLFSSYNCSQDFWRYDPNTNTWTQIADLPGYPRAGAVAFVINNHAYVGTGDDSYSHYFKDFYRYDPNTNTWTQVADLPDVVVAGRFWATSFVIGDYAYVGAGKASRNEYSPFYNLSDFYKYDPSTNTWTRIPNAENVGRFLAVGFTLENRGYIGGGTRGYQYAKYEHPRNFLSYDPNTNQWEVAFEIPYTAAGGVVWPIDEYNVYWGGIVHTGAWDNEEVEDTHLYLLKITIVYQ